MHPKEPVPARTTVVGDIRTPAKGCEERVGPHAVARVVSGVGLPIVPHRDKKHAAGNRGSGNVGVCFILCGIDGQARAGTASTRLCAAWCSSSKTGRAGSAVTARPRDTSIMCHHWPRDADLNPRGPRVVRHVCTTSASRCDYRHARGTSASATTSPFLCELATRYQGARRDGHELCPAPQREHPTPPLPAVVGRVHVKRVALPSAVGRAVAVCAVLRDANPRPHHLSAGGSGSGSGSGSGCACHMQHTHRVLEIKVRGGGGLRGVSCLETGIGG